MINSLSGKKDDRRDAILDAMLAEAGRMRRRRRAVRGGAAVLGAALLAVVAWRPWDRSDDQVAAPPPEFPRHEEPAAPGAESAAPVVDEPPGPRFEIVHTRPGAAAKHVIHAEPDSSRVALLSDDELLAELADLGRSASLVRTRDRAWLVSPDGEPLTF